MSQPKGSVKVYPAVPPPEFYVNVGEAYADIVPSALPKFWGCRMTWAIEDVGGYAYKLWNSVTGVVEDVVLALPGEVSGYYGEVGIDASSWVMKMPGYVGVGFGFSLYEGLYNDSSLANTGVTWNGSDTWSWDKSELEFGMDKLGVYVLGGNIDLVVPVDLYLFFSCSRVRYPEHETDLEFIVGKLTMTKDGILIMMLPVARADGELFDSTGVGNPKRTFFTPLRFVVGVPYTTGMVGAPGSWGDGARIVLEDMDKDGIFETIIIGADAITGQGGIAEAHFDFTGYYYQDQSSSPSVLLDDNIIADLQVDGGYVYTTFHMSADNIAYTVRYRFGTVAVVAVPFRLTMT